MVKSTGQEKGVGAKVMLCISCLQSECGVPRSGVNVKAAGTKVNSGLARLEMELCLKKKKKSGYEYSSVGRTFA